MKMGNGASQDIKPQELAEFRMLDTNGLLTEVVIPERAENRKVTDKVYIIIFAVFVAVLIPFLIYGFVHSNAEVNHFPEISHDHGFYQALSYSYPRHSDGFKEMRDYLNEVSWRIALACIVPFGISFVVLYLFKVATAVVVWSVLIGSLLAGFIFVGALWYIYGNTNEGPALLLVCFITTVGLIILLCMTIFMRNKIRLTITLFRESTKAVFAMPSLILVAFLTLLAVVLMLILWIISSIFIISNGIIITSFYGDTYKELSNTAIFTTLFNTFVAIWAIQIVSGIYFMIISGATINWYFARNKEFLDRPVLNSFYIAIKFHLGTLAFGGLLITLVAMVRAILSSLFKSSRMRLCVSCCMRPIEIFLKILSRNAYILTAMHGTPFLKSGRRAVDIIYKNAINIASINYVSNFVIGMAQITIILLSMLIAEAIMLNSEHTEFAPLVYAIVCWASLVAVSLIGLYQGIIETLFLCFCEDSLLNDGISRPYAMSRELMEFVENSKKIYGEKRSTYTS